jgi:signal transduction histidine kinase/CheY-like chemotaxis protein
VAQVWDLEDDEIQVRVAARDAAILWGSVSLALSSGLSLIMLAATWLLSRRELAARERATNAERASREAAEAASRAKDRMLAVIGHELRTPLTPILMEVSSLQRNEQYQELSPALERIKSHIELEVRLVNDLIDLALLEQGRLRLERRTVDVHEAILDAARLCSDAAPSGERRLKVRLAARRHHIEGDPTRVRQIIWNLLRNALDHVSANGMVEIRTRDESSGGDGGGTLVVEVEDDGVGIEEADLERIFSAFERGKADDRPGGLGLGLSIAQHLAVAQGGSITASSPGPRRGATFCLRLPALEATAELAHTKPLSSLPTHTGVLSLLLVEDHAASRSAIATALRRRGYQVMDVGRIREAIDAATRWEFDLVLSDIELPDGTGLDLMLALERRGARGIALSGYATEDDRKRSMTAGFSEHLAKPVTIDALELAIHRVAAVGPANSRAAI